MPEHVLHTELSIEECKGRLKASVQMATFLPEMRGKAVIGGMKGERFWIRRALETVHKGELWQPVFYGRLVPSEPLKTKVSGHFGLSPAGRAMTIALIASACAVLAAMARHGLDLKSAGWTAVSIVVGVVWARALRRAFGTEKRKLLSFLRRMLTATLDE